MMDIRPDRQEHRSSILDQTQSAFSRCRHLGWLSMTGRG